MTKKKDYTEGGRLVAEAVRRLGAAEVARRARTSEAMARHMATGLKTPGVDLKHRLADAFGVPVEAWSMPAKDEPSSPPRKPRAPGVRRASRGAALPELWATVEQIDVALDALDVDAPATHRAALLRTRSDTLDKIAKLQGEGELTEAQVLRSRPWRTLMARIAPILERHPEVAAEMASALEEVEG